MRKFFAVVKREYLQRVRTKFFVIATILGPLIMAGFAVVPALMFSIKSGGPTRLAIVDQTGKIYERVARELAIDRRAASRTRAQSRHSLPASITIPGPRETKRQHDAVPLRG